MTRYIATCKLGLESVVAGELRRLGIEPERVEDARVTFLGDAAVMARACLWLRTAERLLQEVAAFEARSFDALFEGVRAQNWKQYLQKDSFIHVNGKSAKSKLFSVTDCQSITKKAIVESLRASYHTQVLPETGARVIIEVGILRDVVTLALDCCGAGLSRRGYRTYNVTAPIAETLGAAIMLLSRYNAELPFIDPMCGSGTLPIEAAMLAQNRAPGLNRAFAAEAWPFLPGGTFVRAREEAMDSIVQTKVQILGSDIDPHSIDLCKKHAKKAGVMLEWKVCDLNALQTGWENGLIACNPPYGERMLERREAETLYRDMRRVFDGLPGFRVSVITSHRDFEKVYGKRADNRRKLSNGGIPCTLYQYFRD
ncbi:MAG: class I SAM-dependent RNA methyltransferase [Christensenellaceae bacterium]|jgi:putative N6-adenine-specific DNA methylase|nr:class I SAM-dependent RNA methyltransferase [Christensenellaceae bacterium]